MGSPVEALAFFLNLYHALLLHALLVLGAPRDATTFSKQVSYDVCGDVFSLNDLAQCVLRGRLRPEQEISVPEATTATQIKGALDAVRAKLPKRSASPPKPPTPSNARSPALEDAHWALALAASDGRVALAAHSGARDFPSVILEADPATLPATLDAACARFLDRPGCVAVDERRRVVAPALDDAHWALALDASDGRIALAAHSGARDFPSVIMEADPATLPATLDAACARFLDRPGCVSVDERRRVVALPAACELLVADPEPREVVKALLRFVGKRLWHRLSALLRDEAPVAVVYRPAARRFHEALELSSV